MTMCVSHTLLKKPVHVTKITTFSKTTHLSDIRIYLKDFSTVFLSYISNLLMLLLTGYVSKCVFHIEDENIIKMFL